MDAVRESTSALLSRDKNDKSFLLMEKHYYWYYILKKNAYRVLNTYSYKATNIIIPDKN